MSQPYYASPALANDPYNRQMKTGPYATLGVLLLLGFLLPVVGPSRHGLEAEFINISMLDKPFVPPSIKFELIYPLLAGIAVLVIGATARGVGRATAAIGIALLPVMVLVASIGPELAHETRRLPTELLGSGIAAIFAVLAVVALFGGAIAFRYQRENRAAAITAGIGAGLYIITLLIPTRSVTGDTTIGLIEPFQLMSEFGPRVPAGAVLFVLLRIVQLIIMLTACGFAIRYAFTQDLRDRYTGVILALLIWNIIVGVLSVFCIILSQASGDDVGLALTFVICLVAKLGSWIGALFFLIPVGLADLILCLSANRPEARGFAVTPLNSFGQAPSPYGAYPSASPSAVRASKEDRLATLADALRMGIITEEQYNQQRTQILNDPN